MTLYLFFQFGISDLGYDKFTVNILNKFLILILRSIVDK